MKKVSYLILAASFVFAANVMAIDEQPKGMELLPYSGSTEFEKLKSLVGSWEGTHDNQGKEEVAKVQYTLTSNGSAVIEKLFPGSPHEMISVYHDKKGKLSMTHYCSVGNQPNMDVISMEGNKLSFALSADNNIDVAKEGHMNSLVITFIDENSIEQNWTMFMEGKSAGPKKIILSRVTE